MKKGTKYGLCALGGIVAIGLLGQPSTTIDMKPSSQQESNYVENYNQEKTDEQSLSNIENDKIKETPSVTPIKETDSAVSPTPQVQNNVIVPDNKIDTTVYITKTGKKYHKSSCRFVKKDSVSSISLDKAKSEGYTSCKVCKP